MNAVLEACVHCGDIASALKIFADMSLPHGCGVDTISYSTLLKVQLHLRLFLFGGNCSLTFVNVLLSHFYFEMRDVYENQCPFLLS